MTSIAQRLITLIVLLATGILYGMAAERFELFPYQLIHPAPTPTETAASLVTPMKAATVPSTAPLKGVQINFEETLRIRTSSDVDRARKLLIDVLWGEPGLPRHLPEVETNINDTRYADIDALSRIDRITIAMDYGLRSIAYQFFPKDFNGRTVIYHEGHAGDFHAAKDHIAELLSHGYSVVALSMPLLGMNSKPTVEIAGIGKIRLSRHEHMKFLMPAHGHPIKYFLEPVIVVLNYLRKEFGDAPVSMLGLSGGGWTTTLVAAVDLRIWRSFPVAGSYPIVLRAQSDRDWGDYEQTEPKVYSQVNYLDLYALGSAGRGRKQVKILNKFDPCCFAGDGWQAFYPVIKRRVAALGGGEFELFADDTHNSHAISKAAMARIISELSLGKASN